MTAHADRRLTPLQSWCLTFLLLVATVWAAGHVLGLLAKVVIPVFLAMLFTGLLMPVQVLLNHKLRLPRHLAAAVTLLTSLGLLVGVFAFAGVELARSVGELRETAGEELTRIKEMILDSPLPIGKDEIGQALDQGRSWLTDNSGELARGALAAGDTGTAFVVGGVLTLITTFLFLAQGDAMWAWFVQLLPRRRREPVFEASRRGWVTLSTYAKMQVVISAADAIGIGLGALVLGLPLVAPLTAVTFLLCFIPILGALLSGVLVVLVALFFKGVGTALIMLAIVIAVQQLESDVLSPVLMGKAVNLHPLVTMLAVAAGSYTVGFVGALFAVPMLAVANSVRLYLSGADLFPKLDEGGSALTDSARRLAADGDDPKLPKRLGQATPGWKQRTEQG